MALVDYYLCDICECKTFYDADCSYDDDNSNPKTLHSWPDGDVGAMIVLCNGCAKTHRVQLKKKKVA